MSNVLIVYGSTTGNTADIAEYLGGRLRAAGHAVDVTDAADVSWTELFKASYFLKIRLKIGCT